MKQVKLILQAFLLVVLIVLTFSKCESNNGLIQLIASPDSLVIYDTDSVRELIITTKASGKTNYKVTHKPDWITIESMSGSINKDLKTLKILTQTQNMKEGIYHDYISIISDIAGEVEVPVSLSVKLRPKIELSLKELVFDEKTSQLTLNIDNKGNGILSWQIVNLPNWLKVSTNDQSGYIYPNGKYSFVVSCNRENLEKGVLKANFAIKTNTIPEVVQIPVSMHVPSLLDIRFSSKKILFDYGQSEKELFIVNKGNVGFNWNTAFDDIFTMYPRSGYLNKGDSVKVKISLINRSGFQTGTYTKSFYAYNDASRDTLNVSINNFVNTKWILDRNIADARYCSTTNKIIIISSNPYRLSVIDPETKTIGTVNLNYAPQCLSVEKNGNHAAVGHDKKISYIDLNKMSVIKEYGTNYNIDFIAITSKNRIYYSNFSTFFCIDTNTDKTVSKYTSMYSDGPIVLHPSEKYIFSYSRGTSGDIYKISIADGNIQELYHRTYSMNFWIVNDGSRMYKANWDVLSLSDNQSNDMVYATNFNDLANYYIASISDSKAGNRVCLVTGLNPYTIRAYDYSYLKLLKTYQLESFLVNSQMNGSKLFSGEGKYVFLNCNGSKAYVLLKANSASGLYYEWALQDINIQ